MSRLDSLLSALSPRSEGVDSLDAPVALGGVDSDGCPVGYIDREGLAWASHRERCLAVATGRFDERWVSRFRAPLADPCPAALPFALRYAPLYIRDCLAACRQTDAFRRRFPPLSQQQIDELRRVADGIASGGAS